MSINIENLCYRYEVPFFEHIKDSIMYDINLQPRFGVITQDQELYNTDYYVAPEQRVKWSEPVQKLIIDHQAWLSQQLSSKEHDVIVDPHLLQPMTVWFQQYKTGGAHGWHVHPGSSWSSVLYVELDEDNTGTEILINGEIHKIEAKVGEVVTVPANFYHRSVDTNNNKTVIVWNTTQLA